MGMASSVVSSSEKRSSISIPNPLLSKEAREKRNSRKLTEMEFDPKDLPSNLQDFKSKPEKKKKKTKSAQEVEQKLKSMGTKSVRRMKKLMEKPAIKLRTA